MRQIVTIAREYAEKNFTREFLEKPVEWYIATMLERYYTKEFGKRDDYYHLKGIMTDMKDLHDRLAEILNRGTMQPHGVTLQSCMKHLTNMQFSLGLVRSAVNRQYKFDEEEK